VSERFDVRVVGSANLDIVATTTRHPLPGETVHGQHYHEYPGGKGLNQAVSASRSGARVAFSGAVGTDTAGDRLVGVLRTDGIDATDVKRINGPTGRAVIVVDERGENTIVVVPGANAQVAYRATASPAKVVLAQLEIPTATVAAALGAARADGAITILNPSPATPLPTELIELCDVLVPNEHEVALLGGADTLLAAGCGAVVVTLGGNGVDVHTSSGVDHFDAFRVDVVDTTGAGDAFCGALASRLAAGDDLAVAVRWASAAGALATTHEGAVPAQPTAGAISALLMDQHDG
jgi:ribokinase